MKHLHYFPQRNEADCLITALECLTQHSRECFSNLKYYEDGERYLTYESAAQILNKFSRPFSLFATSHMTLQKESIPMVLGVNSGVKDRFHALFWDGMYAWCGASNNFVADDFSQLKIAYAIVPHSITKLNRCGYAVDWFDQWHKGCVEYLKIPEEKRHIMKREIDYLNIC